LFILAGTMILAVAYVDHVFLSKEMDVKPLTSMEFFDTVSSPGFPEFLIEMTDNFFDTFGRYRRAHAYIVPMSDALFWLGLGTMGWAVVDKLIDKRTKKKEVQRQAEKSKKTEGSDIEEK